MIGSPHVGSLFGLRGLLLGAAQDPAKSPDPGSAWRGFRPAAQDPRGPLGPGPTWCGIRGGRFNAGYQVQHGAHVQRASLCETLHTLHTQHTGWVDAMRSVDAEECRSFLAMYDAAAKVPELVGVAQRVEDR